MTLYNKYIKLFFRYDFDKFCGSVDDVIQGLENRLRQWLDYEHQFEKIIAWLAESEKTLKGFGARATMEEKLAQLDHFQVKSLWCLYTLCKFSTNLLQICNIFAQCTITINAEMNRVVHLGSRYTFPRFFSAHLSNLVEKHRVG